LALPGQRGRYESPAAVCQQRLTQSRVAKSRVTGATGTAAHCASNGRMSDAANDAGSTDRPNCGDRWAQLAGRSCVIHMLWNGFLFVGAESGEMPCARWLMASVAG